MIVVRILIRPLVLTARRRVTLKLDSSRLVLRVLRSVVHRWWWWGVVPLCASWGLNIYCYLDSLQKGWTFSFIVQ